ncbi:MAG: insulinase family protein, partial [Acidobacteria bacterium]|nr:insulinase family protein [Acidobacteriota bacterium]
MSRRTTQSASIIALISLISLITLNSFAQSGRGRPTAPPPQPKPTPRPNVPVTTVLGIPEGGKLVKQDLDGSTSRYLLQNKLNVVIRERHSSPLVSVNVTVKAGSVNESDEKAGMSQLTRQMILRGTAKRPGAAIDKDVARLGGILTSQVSYDHTSFNIIAPVESYQGVVELFSDLILRPAFNASDLKKAAQLVVLESRREQDRVASAATEKLYATAFTANRLKRGSSVSESMLASVTREQVQSYYQNFYQPENTVITVVGDVFSIQALGQVQLRFGEFKKSAAPTKPAAQPAPALRTVTRNSASTETTTPPPAVQDPFSPNPDEPAQDMLRYANSRADISQSFVTIGYRTPVFKPDKEGLKERATMQMLAAVLGLGNSSRLWQGLREGLASRDKSSVAIETSANYLALPGAGMLVVHLRVDPDRIDRAEAEYFREIERFRRELIGNGELQRARTMLEKRYYDAASRFEEEAQALAISQAQLGDFRLFDSNLARLRAVTAQEIQQAAAKYLALANSTVIEYEPRNAQARTFTPEKFAELIVTFAAGAAQPVRPEEVKPAVALKTFTQGAERGTVSEGQNVIVASVPLPLKDYSVLRGPRAYVREDKSQPRLSVSVIFQGGRLIEDQTTSGMTELMLRAMLKSTTTRKADLIALELESYGGEIRLVNEADFFGYTLDVLSRNAENAVKLLLEIIEKPFFDKEELVKERAALLARQLQRRDDEDVRANELMWLSLYPGHPYGLPRFGLAEVVKTINEEKLEAWHARTIQKQFPLVVLVGDTDGSALVSRIFSEGLKRGDLDKTIKVGLPTTMGPPEEKTERRNNQQTAQAIGFRVLSQSISGPNDSYAAEMFSLLTASGRMLEEMRDKQGLTNDVTVGYEQRLAAGAFFVQFASSPENEQRAREVAQALLQQMASVPPSDEEFEQGRNAAIGRYAIELQSHPERSLEYARAVIYGRKPSDVETQPDSIRAVKKADIKRVAESVIKANQVGRGV